MRSISGFDMGPARDEEHVTGLRRARGASGGVSTMPTTEAMADG
jgi:hypothetical protein